MFTWPQFRNMLAEKTAAKKIPWRRLPGNGFIIYHAKVLDREIWVYPDKVIYRTLSKVFVKKLDTAQWVVAIEAYLSQPLTADEALDDLYTTINTV